MIFLLLIVTKVAANTEADFYAVKVNEKDGHGYSVFTRVGNCSVYKGGCTKIENIFFHILTFKTI